MLSKEQIQKENPLSWSELYIELSKCKSYRNALFCVQCFFYRMHSCSLLRAVCSWISLSYPFISALWAPPLSTHLHLKIESAVINIHSVFKSTFQWKSTCFAFVYCFMSVFLYAKVSMEYQLKPCGLWCDAEFWVQKAFTPQVPKNIFHGQDTLKGKQTQESNKRPL